MIISYLANGSKCLLHAYASKRRPSLGAAFFLSVVKAAVRFVKLAVMLCRYARLPGMDTTADGDELNAFNDGASTHDWAVDGMAWCAANSILQGKGNATLAPTATATRAQMAVMLQRFMELTK